MRDILRVFAALFLILTTFLLMGSYVQGPPSWGSTAAPAPPTFACPNEGVTGTTNGLAAKLSADNTCIVAATADAGTGGASVLGIVVRGGGTTGSALVAPFAPIVPCTFDNATTFGHWAILSSTTAANCRDNGSAQPQGGPTTVQLFGIILDTGAAGTHNVLLNAWKAGLLQNTLINSTSRVDSGNFNGQFLWRDAAGGAAFFQMGGTASTFPCVANAGALLKVLQAGTNCTSGDGNLGTGHLSSDNAAPPTISSGFGTNPSIVSGGDLAFLVNVGTGGAATSGVVAFGTAFTTAPSCMAEDTTTIDATRASASTTQVTLTATVAWTASDVVAVHCIGQNGL